MSKILDYFDRYLAMGLKPIAIYKETKVPVGKKWNKNYSSVFWRDLIETGEYNMGILLGDIVDVEGDTKDANDFLLKLIGNTPHPSYLSSKSIHHLFLNPDKSLTAMSHEGIEFRANKHQSVVPPSTHIDGTSYRWLKISKFPIPEMPKDLMDFYYNIKSIKSKKNKFKRDYLKKNHIKTKCNKCKNEFFINKKRIVLESRAFLNYGENWMCRSCRDIDVREECRKIRKIQKSNYF